MGWVGTWIISVTEWEQSFPSTWPSVMDVVRVKLSTGPENHGSSAWRLPYWQRQWAANGMLRQWQSDCAASLPSGKWPFLSKISIQGGDTLEPALGFLPSRVLGWEEWKWKQLPSKFPELRPSCLKGMGRQSFVSTLGTGICWVPAMCQFSPACGWVRIEFNSGPFQS